MREVHLGMVSIVKARMNPITAFYMNHLHEFYWPDTQVPEKYEYDTNSEVKLLEPAEPQIVQPKNARKKNQG